MRILQVSPDFPPFVRGGGAETFELLSMCWEGMGHQVTNIISVPNSQYKNIEATETPSSMRVFRMFDKLAFLKGAAYYFPIRWGDRKKLKKWIRENADSYDLIIIQGILESITRTVLMSLDKQLRERVILTNHGIPTAPYSKILHLASLFLYKTIGKILLNGVSHVIMYSKSTMDEFGNFFSTLRGIKIYYHNSGIDMRNLKNIINSQYWKEGWPWKEVKNKYNIDGNYIFSVGRNTRVKGFDKLIEAFAEVVKNEKELSLIIAGDPSDHTIELKELSKKLKIDEKVKFIGRVSELEKIALISNCSTFAIPSLKEGYGLNAIEGRVLCVTTIATDTGAHKEILEGYELGSIVPPGDPYALSQSIMYRMKEDTRGDLASDPDAEARFDICSLAKYYLEIQNDFAKNTHATT